MAQDDGLYLRAPGRTRTCLFQARSAAARYFRYDAAADRAPSALVHDDHELEAEAISTGKAFRGTIVKVWAEGSGRKTIPVLQLEDSTPGPLSLRHGESICIVGHPKRTGRVREIETTKGGALGLTVEIANRKTEAPDMSWPHSMHAADPRWIGQALTVIGTSFADMTEKKAIAVSRWDSTPGDWLLTSHAENDVSDETSPEPDEPGAS